MVLGVAGSTALLLAATATAMAAKDHLPLRVMQWLKVDGGADEMIAAIAYDPGVCLAANASSSAREGAVLFRAPTLLGGQAAKARLSCASCHVGGGDNPHFHFPSASGVPGTADVSNSFFSAAGANGAFDPAVIPDLSHPGKVSRRVPGEMEAFLRTLIVTEFAGAEPDSQTLAALAEYIRALEPCDSDAPHMAKPGLAADLALVEWAASMAEQRLAARDDEMARLLVAGARDTLGLIHERFAGADFARERSAIEHVSIDLKAAAGGMQGDNRRAAFAVWRETFQSLFLLLQKQEERSLYNQTELRAALGSGSSARSVPAI